MMSDDDYWAQLRAQFYGEPIECALNKENTRVANARNVLIDVGTSGPYVYKKKPLTP